MQNGFWNTEEEHLSWYIPVWVIKNYGFFCSYIFDFTWVIFHLWDLEFSINLDIKRICNFKNSDARWKMTMFLGLVESVLRPVVLKADWQLWTRNKVNTVDICCNFFKQKCSNTSHREGKERFVKCTANSFLFSDQRVERIIVLLPEVGRSG